MLPILPEKLDLCPCNSGRIFILCHGRYGDIQWPPREILQAIEKKENEEKARLQSEGHGRPPIVVPFPEHNFSAFAVGNKIMHGRWKTFHDFLLDYIKETLGKEWGNQELQKTLEERHIILQWYQKVCEYQYQTIKQPGQTVTCPMIGVVEAYMGLSYNLYLLAHNEELQQILINRLKQKDQFPGAYSHYPSLFR